MAVVDCASCGRRISSRAGRCPHCDADTAARLACRRPKALTPHYLLAMLAFIAGIAWFFADYAAGVDRLAPRLLAGAGLVWYLAARGWSVLRR